MKFKITTLAALLAASTSILYATPTIDNGRLGVANQTTYLLSFTVNNICSKDLGNVDSHSIKTVSTTKIVKSCGEANTCDITAL